MERNNRGLVVALVVLAAIVLIAPLISGGMMGFGMVGPGMMRGFGRGVGPLGGWGWGFGVGLGWLAMLAFWGAIIVGIVLLFRAMTGPHAGGAGPSGESALDILKRRFASGEISQEQYEQMRQRLEA